MTTHPEQISGCCPDVAEAASREGHSMHTTHHREHGDGAMRRLKQLLLLLCVGFGGRRPAGRGRARAARLRARGPTTWFRCRDPLFCRRCLVRAQFNDSKLEEFCLEFVHHIGDYSVTIVIIYSSLATYFDFLGLGARGMHATIR